MPSYSLSYWEKSIFFDQQDVVIIGSGIVGLNAAISIKEEKPNARVLILERGSLPIGASTRNAGFACFGSATELLADLKTHGEDAVWQLVEQRWEGLMRLRQRVGDHHLEYKEYGGYELFKVEETALFEACLDSIPDFNQRLKGIIGTDQHFKQVDYQIADFGFEGVKHLLINSAEGQINTGKMMQALLKLALEKGVQIMNGIEVDHLEHNGNTILLSLNGEWEVNSEKVLVATNGFAKQLLPKVAVRPARNQVLVTKPINGLKIKGCFHYDQGYYYFRNIDGRVLFGGGRNLRLEEEFTDRFGMTAAIQDALVNLLDTVILPNTPYEIDYWWSGILGVGEQKAPIIEKLNDNLVVAVRLGGMGVALGTKVGEKAAKLLLDG